MADHTSAGVRRVLWEAVITGARRTGVDTPELAERLGISVDALESDAVVDLSIDLIDVALATLNLKLTVAAYPPHFNTKISLG